MKIQKNKIIASVIIVNFNNAKYLSKSIDSVLSQTINQKKKLLLLTIIHLIIQ